MEAAGPRSTHGVTQLQRVMLSPQNTIPNCYFLSSLPSSKENSMCQFLVREWHFDHIVICMETWTEFFWRAVSLSVWMIGKTHACRNRSSLFSSGRPLPWAPCHMKGHPRDNHWEAVICFKFRIPAKCSLLDCYAMWTEAFLHLLLRPSYGKHSSSRCQSSSPITLRRLSPTSVL